MVNEALAVRRQRGLEIAATTKITQTGEGEWAVPSQSGGSQYRVIKDTDGFQCSCPDYELRVDTCKHGFAVEFVLRRETRPDGTVIETRAARVTYPQNWRAYNRAQTSEKAQFCVLLRDLVADVPTPGQKRGRPALPLSDMIFAAAFKVYSTVSARRFMTDLDDAREAGHIDRTPHYNSIFNALDREDVTPILHELITRSALPLRSLETEFAVDSTGFGLQAYYRHFSAKYGRELERRDYLKLHIMVGTKTNVITAAAVTDRFTNDSPLLPSLLNETATYFDVQEVSADKGYSSKRNLATIEGFGAKPFVAFKCTAIGQTTSRIWNKAFHFFLMNQEEFQARYHRRSNVESTFSAMKRKLGDTLRSKTPVAQRNELLLKVLCHNLICLIHEIHESGALGLFPTLAEGCTKNRKAAQEARYETV